MDDDTHIRSPSRGLRALVLTPTGTILAFENFDVATSGDDVGSLSELVDGVPIGAALALGLFRAALPGDDEHHQLLGRIFDRLGARKSPTTLAKASWAFLSIKRREGWVPLVEGSSETSGISVAFQLSPLASSETDSKAVLLVDRSSRQSLIDRFSKANIAMNRWTRVIPAEIGVGGVSMRAILAHPPVGPAAQHLDQKGNRLVWKGMRIPAKARLECHLGLRSRQRVRSDGIEFSVLVDDEIIAQRTVGVDPWEPDTWLPWWVDLEAYGGQTVSFELRVDPLESTQNDHALWGEPMIVVDR